MNEPKPLLEIVRGEWERAGGRGRMPPEFVARWRRSHPAYDRWPLWVQFHSGSTVPVSGNTRMSRTMRAWVEAGKPSPGRPGFTWEDFGTFAAQYRDEYDEYEPDKPGKLLALASQNGEIVSIRK